jgi:ankyrin repeat protein
MSAAKRGATAVARETRQGCNDVLQVALSAFEAARNGNTALLRSALDAGLPVQACNEKGDTLLMLASYHGHREAAGLLLARGASPDAANDRGQTPLAGAAFKGDVAMAALLLDGGATVDAADPQGRTALFFAAIFDRLELVELLLARGAAPGRVDHTGATPLAAARAMGAVRTLAVLDVRDEPTRQVG